MPAPGAKGLLGPREHKSIQTDRVVLVPGPSEEIATVRWIYQRFVEDRRDEAEIAAELNERGVRTDLGRLWTRGTVHQILINEKYIGNNVWNRVSFRLKQRRVVNDPSLWARADGAFEGIVDHRMFDAARAIIQAKSQHLTNEEMLALLRGLFERTGLLSGLIIDEADGCPSSSAYQHRFGGLLSGQAFARAMASESRWPLPQGCQWTSRKRRYLHRFLSHLLTKPRLRFRRFRTGKNRFSQKQFEASAVSARGDVVGNDFRARWKVEYA